jgi:hypothetical protein
VFHKRAALDALDERLLDAESHHWPAQQDHCAVPCHKARAKADLCSLSARLLQSVSGDTKLPRRRRSQLDRLYQRVADDFDKLFAKVGLNIAA